jgi:GH15 family glucan-1,4-alpha-glucosidase
VTTRIEDYALIGDCETAALVSRSGSIDWLCLPRFASGACFAALLGGEEHGRWRIAPHGEARAIRRAYRDGSLVLETTFETDEGVATLVDCMPLRQDNPRLVRVVHGERGRVRMTTDLIIRFDYGSIVPWVRKVGGGLQAIAGADSVIVESDVPLRGKGLTTVGEFDVRAHETVRFVLTWHASHTQRPPSIEADRALVATERTWRRWSRQCTYVGPWRDAVVRSLVTLKALGDARTGGIVAAPTTSLPEALGGVRNWDYRHCWLRDATFTLLALLGAGYREEARSWRQWLLRAVAGDPSELQIMYGTDGTRRLTETILEWLPGYEGSAPVRIGNAAHTQRQTDVYGEVVDATYQSFKSAIELDPAAWDLQRALLESLESRWPDPDDGIWEVRGPRRQFVHSKMMAWVAFDRGVRLLEEGGFEGPADRWRDLCHRIKDEICREGYDPKIGAFVQSYGSKHLDASLLLMPLVGFLPVSDARVRGTIEAIRSGLRDDGFVRRYDSDESVDGLPGGEGAFLACSFWLADCLALLGQREEARTLFEKLLAVRNDVGLLSEQYDVRRKRLVGNFPQAFSHVSLVNTARNLSVPAAAHAGVAQSVKAELA